MLLSRTLNEVKKHSNFSSFFNFSKWSNVSIITKYMKYDHRLRKKETIVFNEQKGVSSTQYFLSMMLKTWKLYFSCFNKNINTNKFYPTTMLVTPSYYKSFTSVSNQTCNNRHMVTKSFINKTSLLPVSPLNQSY